MSFNVGNLVKARNREWVVLPGSDEKLLLLKPLGGTDQDATGILPTLENVTSASFDLPKPDILGDYHSARLLRDAVRFGFRASAGPFRSFGRLNVEPRPYQLVPLLMALKQDPVRILIADDVGIGKTIEAALIARELLDRGEVQRLAVLCPPHLAEQWQSELKEKFNIEAELVLSSTAAKLERNKRLDESLFDIYPFTVVSLDFIKSEKNRTEFLRSCPEIVIVDEAHTCAVGNEGVTQKHQRHKLLKGLSEDSDRHLILVTAVPHSGNEDAFRSLLELLNPDLKNLPVDLTGAQNEANRRKLAEYIVQRKRGNIKKYLDTETTFPLPVKKELTYSLSAEYKDFFNKVISFIVSSLPTEGLSEYKKRFRWWSALALMRCMASSPAAAAATLRSRALTNEADSVEELDQIGRDTVFDLSTEDTVESMDITPGAELDEEKDDSYTRRKMLEFVKIAESLKGDHDQKLVKIVSEVKELLREGFSPIVFCRFIETSDYVAAELRNRLPNDVEVTSVTGTLPPSDREARVLELGQKEKHVLVCTDCLSEGINLQDNFDAVIHYDLSWNPTRHEQREGRVDRFGQANPKVKILTYYGVDNGIDGIVVDILLKKHDRIKSSLGYSVPVPIDNDKIIEAIFEGLLFREQAGKRFINQMELFEDYIKPRKEDVHKNWDVAVEREKKSRAVYAQETIDVKEVAEELNAVKETVGTKTEVENFIYTSLVLSKAVISKNGVYSLNLTESPRAIKEIFNNKDKVKVKFDKPVKEGTVYLHRTHPIVQNISSYVIEGAFDSENESLAKRSGVIRTRGVEKKTTLMLLRLRYQINRIADRQVIELLAEDLMKVAFTDSINNPSWLSDEDLDKLLVLSTDANVPVDIGRDEILQVEEKYSLISSKLEEFAIKRGEELRTAHMRVRKASKIKGVKYEVLPKLPVDVLGIYVYLPMVR